MAKIVKNDIFTYFVNCKALTGIKMKTRKLGSLEVSAIGFGCMGISEYYGDADHEGGRATIRRALTLGVNFLDTADGYGHGKNEELLGEILQETTRDKVIVATKCGFVRSQTDPRSRSINTTPDYIKAACENSLRRLSTDYIDLFYLHRLDQKTPIEESMQALSELVRAGKIRHIGLCEVDAETIRRAHAIHPLSAIQSEYSLWSRGQEKEIIPVCEELGIGFVAYSPLGRGFLGGEMTSASSFGTNDFRHFAPRFEASNLQSNLELVTQLNKVAAEKNCTLPQLSLAWLLAKGETIVPIPGTKKIGHLENNVGAVNVELTRAEVEMLDKMTAAFEVQGERYPEQIMRTMKMIQ